MDRSRRGLRRIVALAAAAGVHVLLALILLSPPPPPPPATSDTNVIQVELRQSADALRPSTVRQPRGGAGLSPHQPAPQAPATPPPIPGTILPTAPSAAPSPAPPSEAGANLRRALNATFGCDLPGGPRPEDRARCAERFASAGGTPRSFGVEPAQRAYFDAKAQEAKWWEQPVLGAIPRNGCAPLVTNQQAAVTGGEITADSRWRGSRETWRTGGPSSSTAPTEWRSTNDWRVGVGCGLSFFNAMRRR